ncbi:hypothetical protein VP1G_10482 [Cytospora mali]|uniref:Uncharacterized protein n=1 Tax=Cytospora mali TaxID=578113 RepID=A0A194UMD5_CYTMA|nr:hypothetical protein VP1G_10482 [Valsa mali var. pyri (nom. inval.)]
MTDQKEIAVSRYTLSDFVENISYSTQELSMRSPLAPSPYVQDGLGGGSCFASGEGPFMVKSGPKSWEWEQMMDIEAALAHGLSILTQMKPLHGMPVPWYDT